jgi:hypothetical protein
MLLAVSGVAFALVLAVSFGAISLPGTNAGPQSADASDLASLAAKRTAADKRWASSACTSVLNWKKEITHDATSLNLGFGAMPRIKDAIAATNRLVDRLDTLGLPPSAQIGHGQADLARLRADLSARVAQVEADANRVTSGNLAAIGSLLSDLENDRAVAPQLAQELRHVVSVDLGLSLAETQACRQLVGSPI